MSTMKNTRFILLAAPLIAFSACNNGVDTTYSQVNLLDTPNAVCDPFTTTSSGTQDNGLAARLYYLPEGAPHYTSVADYFANGTEVSADLFFNQIYTPTRPFDRGFVRQDGSVITNDAGNTLYEYFALHFESSVQLTDNDVDGKYQFAVLTDDGSILRLDERGAGMAELVNNDRTTPSRFACATRTVRLDHSSQIPMEFDYFQGPRYHIALIVLWRHISDDVDENADPSVLSDSACGLAGNGTFFDSTQNPPAPTAVWDGMMSRGWKVLEPGNYRLPERFRTNPCNVVGT